MKGTLQLDDNESRQLVYWRVERVGWVCMLFLVIAALAGVFGAGLYSEAEVTGQGIRVQYSRFTRVTKTGGLEITIQHPADNPTVWISREYLQSFEVYGILPQPVSSRTTREQHVFSFAAAPGEPLHVTVQVKPRDNAFGFRDGRIGTATGEAAFWQFVWP